MSTREKTEKIHPFVWQQGAVDILKDASMMGLHEYDEGIDAYLKQRKYHLLAGSVAPLEVWETSSPGNRFTVVACYPTVTIVVQIQDGYGLQSWLAKYMPAACILPEVMIPKRVEAPSNRYSVLQGRL